MSLLGFDAIGRTALGGAPRASVTNTVFAAEPASYAFTGGANSFTYQAASNPGAFAWLGSGLGFTTVLSGPPGPYAIVGKTAATLIGFSVGTGSLGFVGLPTLAATRMALFGTAYAASGQALNCITSLLAQGGVDLVSGKDVSFGRGFDNWFALPRDADEWIGHHDPENAWLPAQMHSNDWSIEAKANMPWTTPSVTTSAWTSNEPAKRAD